jgi:predicted membrane chloride channel (bestrophin family)
MFAVLPLCILNCGLLALVDYVRGHYRFEFSANGHGLLTLLVSFLVISKVNLAYDRYKAVRQYAGQGSINLRELIQMVIAVSNATSNNEEEEEEDNISSSTGDRERELRQWRLECVAKATEIMDASVCVLKDRSLAKHFAHNKALETPPVTKRMASETFVSDPLTLIQSLRMHLYCTPGLGLESLQKMHLVNKLQEYTSCYAHLLNLASTPLPFPLVQMGRAFLLIWTFSMPLVLLDGPFDSVWSAQVFLFFLTYGFIGLELVSIKLSDPFGNGRDDVQISGIRDACIVGIENDLKEMTAMQVTISERRRRFSRTKRTPVRETFQPPQPQGSTSDPDVSVYHSMGSVDVHL